MQFNNPFDRPLSAYSRDLNILQHCHEDNAFYLSKITGDPLSECMDFILKITSAGGELPLKDPRALVLCRDDGHDKEAREMTASTFISTVIDKNYIISPSMAVYCSTEEEESLLSKKMIINTARRAKAKGEMFEAKVAKNTFLYTFKNTQQTAFKLGNNSLSGAQVSQSTPLYDKSAHSALTSTCRTETSYGNSLNEKFIAGNRHYRCPDVVLANITSICRLTDMNAMQQLCVKYQLHLPTVDEVMEMITYSSNFYWYSEPALADIQDYVTALTGIERAAVMYISDLFHLHKYNPELVVDILTTLATKDSTTMLDNPDDYIKAMDDDLKAYIGMVCPSELRGTSIKNIKTENPKSYNTVAATAKKIVDTLDNYRDIIETLWLSANMPVSVAYLPGLIRRAVPTSDTDSTIFTARHWTIVTLGKRPRDDVTAAISATITYLSTQIIAHTLAQMSANIGVTKEHIRKLGMKNEYYFPDFFITPRAKHYAALRGAQEGNVFDKFETEIKGVELRSSVLPAHLLDRQTKFIELILNSIYKKDTVSIYELFDELALVELEIMESIRRGSRNYLSSGKIKDYKSYKNPESSNYIYYYLWEEVFAPKYGHAPNPEYSCIKVSIDADKPAKLKAWIASIEDRGVASRLEAWLNKRGRNSLTQILLPADIVQAKGVPEEIIQAVSMRKLVYGLVSGFYLAMEGLGIYMYDANLCRLVSDEYSPRITETKLV